jgi:hypothetical protein
MNVITLWSRLFHVYDIWLWSEGDNHLVDPAKSRCFFLSYGLNYSKFCWINLCVVGEKLCIRNSSRDKTQWSNGSNLVTFVKNVRWWLLETRIEPLRLSWQFLGSMWYPPNTRLKKKKNIPQYIGSFSLEMLKFSNINFLKKLPRKLKFILNYSISRTWIFCQNSPISNFLGNIGHAPSSIKAPLWTPNCKIGTKTLH